MSLKIAFTKICDIRERERDKSHTKISHFGYAQLPLVVGNWIRTLIKSQTIGSELEITIEKGLGPKKNSKIHDCRLISRSRIV
ncbi:hypothetical protein BpHYR1_025036 [Brachionus plicatilis]|uniref:Uncharacterized protein n=1 Tax=Brachionus plicatilis TaxID=10195 RepID=A0A3M7RPW7_BRAPC|nr:hypothetical protein BpHYR1_025036 [Brachionus plicatilis]